MAVELDVDDNGALDIDKGGTNASTIEEARENLGVLNAPILYADVIAAEAAEGAEDDFCYVLATDTTYRYWVDASAYVPDDAFVLDTGDGGLTRWLAISGKYNINDLAVPAGGAVIIGNPVVSGAWRHKRTNGSLVFEELVDTIWMERMSLEDTLVVNSLRLGKDFKVTAAGHHVMLESSSMPSGEAALLLQAPFDDTGSSDPMAPMLEPKDTRLVEQDIDTTEANANTYIWTHNETYGSLVNKLHLKVGTIVPDEVVKLNIFYGTDATGLLFYEYVIHPSVFVANTEIEIPLPEIIGLPKNTDIFFRLDTNDTLSLFGTPGQNPWRAVDRWVGKHEKLSYASGWTAKTYAVDDRIVQGGLFYTCNTAGAQVTDFVTNAALWNLGFRSETEVGLTSDFDNTLITKSDGTGTIVYDVSNPTTGQIAINGGTVTRLGKLLAYQFHVISDQDAEFALQLDTSLVPGEIVSISVAGDDGSLDQLGIRLWSSRKVRFNRDNAVDFDLDHHILLWVDGGTEMQYLPAGSAEVIDDDSFGSATANNVPSAESVKAYVDENTTGIMVAENALVALSVDQLNINAGTVINLLDDTGYAINNNVTFNNTTHRATLKAGKTYKLQAFMRHYGSAASTYANYDWYDVTNSVWIGKENFISALDYTGSVSGEQSTTTAMITPLADIDVELRCISVSAANQKLAGGATYATIEKIGDTVGVPAASEYFKLSPVDNLITDGASSAPGVGLPAAAIGQRYVVVDTSAMHANWGTITGLEDNDIIEYNGAAWIVSFDISASTAGDGVVVCNKDADSFLLTEGVAWVSSAGGGSFVPPDDLSTDLGDVTHRFKATYTQYLQFPTDVGDQISPADAPVDSLLAGWGSLYYKKSSTNYINIMRYPAAVRFHSTSLTKTNTSQFTSSTEPDTSYINIRFNSSTNRLEYKLKTMSYLPMVINLQKRTSTTAQEKRVISSGNTTSWVPLGSNTAFDSLSAAGDYLDIRIMGPTGSYDGVLTIKAMVDGNNLTYAVILTQKNTF